VGKPVGSGLSAAEADHLAKRVKAELLARWPDLAGPDGIRTTRAAELTGVAQSLLSQILKGSKTNRRAGIRSLVRLRYTLGVSIDDLLGLKPLDTRTTDLDLLRTALDEGLRVLRERENPQR
jgi:transcriptional regulator with XRE-family HTH domain